MDCGLSNSQDVIHHVLPFDLYIVAFLLLQRKHQLHVHDEGEDTLCNFNAVVVFSRT